jgi:hypothetical protein
MGSRSRRTGRNRATAARSTTPSRSSPRLA